MIDILHRYTKAILYHSETAQTIAEAVVEASLQSADLRSADLRSADLSSANLRSADLSSANLSSADLSSANLWSADLSSANLSSANLRSADLYSADLRSANLSYADLSSADLRWADLRWADLRWTNGVNPHRVTPLLMLHDQPGIIRAYKLVTADGIGPYNGSITYEVGQTYEVTTVDTDPMNQCGAGINLATLDWCLREWKEGYRILTADFTAADIAAIPTATDGKFRVHRCTISGTVDLVKIGLILPSEVAVA